MHLTIWLLATRMDAEGYRLRREVYLKTGTISVRFQSSWTDKLGTHMVDWEKDSFDLVAVYCPETDACYYFDHTQFERHITLRVEASKNNQSKGINPADDYLRVP